MLGKCRNRQSTCEEFLVLDNGHLLDQVLKGSGILQRIVHKEHGITSRTKCCWNSQKADILLSVQRLHCPGVNSRAKDMENCRYTSLQMKQQLKQFFALSFLSISWPGRWGPQGRAETGGDGLARVPNLCACKHLLTEGWQTQRWKDELASCRGAV